MFTKARASHSIAIFAQNGGETFACVSGVCHTPQNGGETLAKS
jgi:hypothetical protein